MDRSFWELIWESLKSTYNTIIGTVSLVLSIALWFLLPDTQVSLRTIVPIVGLALVLSIAVAVTLLNAAIQANREANEESRNHQELQDEYDKYKARGGAGLPNVVEGKNPREGTQATLRCVLEPSQLFSQDHMVSFYGLSRQGIEEFVGIGVVEHIQGDRRIHVTMIYAEKGQEGFTERLRQNEGEAVRSTLVKPGVPRRYTSFESQGERL